MQDGPATRGVCWGVDRFGLAASQSWSVCAISCYLWPTIVPVVGSLGLVWIEWVRVGVALL